MKDEKHIAKQAHILSECQGAENPFAFSKFIYVTSVMFFKGKELGGGRCRGMMGEIHLIPGHLLCPEQRKINHLKRANTSLLVSFFPRLHINFGGETH